MKSESSPKDQTQELRENAEKAKLGKYRKRAPLTYCTCEDRGNSARDATMYVSAGTSTLLFN
jgi:hypothetical protein